MKATGVVNSTNHPGPYPHNLDKTHIIEVESGKILRLEFTHFSVDICGYINRCSCDFVKIMDVDGTTLMDNSCGDSSGDPSDPDYILPLPIITTRSNRVEIFFHTNDDWFAKSGWSLSWSAVTPGECQQHLWMFLANFSIIDDALKNTRCFQPKQTRLCFSFLF